MRGLLARLDTEAFAPSAASAPLPAELREALTAATRRWRATPRPRTSGAAAILLVVGIALPAAARADDLAAGRAAYQDALSVTGDAALRRRHFARPPSCSGPAAATPRPPGLDADWGNAALGAGDLGAATLEFRRALAVDASNARARQNLAWLRAHAAQPAAGQRRRRRRAPVLPRLAARASPARRCHRLRRDDPAPGAVVGAAPTRPARAGAGAGGGVAGAHRLGDVRERSPRRRGDHRKRWCCAPPTASARRPR
ncbi:MAG: hypothetical protein R2939_10170 [Kofleriaceae bacterium]